MFCNHQFTDTIKSFVDKIDAEEITLFNFAQIN